MTQETSKFSAVRERHPDLGEVIYLRYAGDDKNKNMEVGIVPNHGSNMFRFRVGADDLIYCDTKALARHEFTGNFVMFPFPNRVRDKKYRWEGKEYDLHHVAVPSDDPHLVHGLVRDRTWEVKEVRATDHLAAATTVVETVPGDSYFYAYPFRNHLLLRFFLLQDRVRIEYEVQNLGAVAMPFGFGMHPLFSTSLSGGKGAFISLPAQYVMGADDSLLPDGTMRPVSVRGELFDLSSPRCVADLSLDHVYAGLPGLEKGVIDYTNQRMRLFLSGWYALTHCTVYTMQREKFICIEHQTCSTDAINLYDKGLNDAAHLMVLDPGKVHVGFVEYKVETY